MMISESKKTFVCPSCKRKFATSGALRQHEAAAHGKTRKRARPRRRRGKAAASVVSASGVATSNVAARTVSGSDMLGLIDVQAPGSTGKRLLVARINPRGMGGRLAAESRLWSRWRPRRLAMRVVSSASSYVGGMYTMGWIANPAEVLPVGASAVAKLSTYQPHVTAQVNQSSSLTLPTETTQKWYLLEGAEDESTHGVVHAVLSAQLNNLTAGSTISLYVHLDWTVEFSGPELPTEEESDEIFAVDSYAPYFTDSVSDWDSGTKVTLKAREGGGVVPFPNAVTGQVYALDPKGRLDVLVRGASATAFVSHGVRIKDYPVPGLAVFTSLATAKKYAKSGDANDCMTYFGAGGYVRPSNPPWRAVDEVTLVVGGRTPAPQQQLAVSDHTASHRLARLERSLRKVLIEHLPLDPVTSALRVLVEDPVPTEESSICVSELLPSLEKEVETGSEGEDFVEP